MNQLRRFALCVTISVLSAFGMASCKIKQVESEVEPPPRPAGVPGKALWAGGADGGSFIILEPTSSSGQYVAKIYHESTGDIEFDGALRLDSQTGAPIDVRDPKTYGFWDGDTLHLRDGRTLSPKAR